MAGPMSTRCATLYFLLAGHPPFPGTDIRHKLAAKQYHEPVPIHRLRPDVDEGLSVAIHVLLARDPAVRCPSAEAAATTLAPFAAPVADFPARLFRPNRPSTGDPSKEHIKLSATERLRKPDAAADQAPATDVLTKAPTTLVMEALAGSGPSAPPPVWPHIARWVAIVVLAVLIGTCLALIWTEQ